MGSLKMESQSVQDIIPFMITGICNPNMLQHIGLPLFSLADESGGTVAFLIGLC
jgi:hypothetical protein